MKIPPSDTSASARRLLQAKKVARLLGERQADVESTFMADLIRSMSRSLVAIGFGADFIAEEIRILRSLVEKEMASGLTAG